MRLPDGVTLLATICNTTRNAVPFALWMARGERQYMVDLSDALDKPGDVGLTGLAWLDGHFYAAVQTSTSPRILVLNRQLAVVDVVSSPDFMDLHSLHAADDTLIAASTGHNAVVRVDPATRATYRVCGLEAKLHANSAFVSPGRTLVCCHYAARIVPEATGGGVVDVTQGRVVVDGLDGPHSLMPDGSAFLVLDSGASRVIRFDDGGILQEQALGGFLGGCSIAGDTLYVASSTRRVVSRKRPDASVARSYWEDMRAQVRIFTLDAASLAVTGEYAPLVPGFEIYEMLVVDSARAPDPPADRLLEPDANMLAQAYYEAAKFAYAELHQRATAAG
jgi:hypothetical protein